MKLEIFDRFSINIQTLNFMKIRPVGDELSKYTSKETGRQT